MKKCIAFFSAATLGIVFGIILSSIFWITDVTDNSMLPSYTEEEKILVRSQSYGASSPIAGDVVLFPNLIYNVTGEGRVMMKRIIAVPGDSVFITGGRVYVNNKVLDEEGYVFSEDVSGEMTSVKVPAEQVFVLGDNRAESTDSRSETVGLVKIENLLGKVIYKW